MSLSEFDIIANYFKRPPQQASVSKSIGDDCAIVTVDPDLRLVMSMDTLVAGRHFPDTASAAQIATRAFCTSISDLAAMGATPCWFTLGLTLPQVSEDWLKSFSESLFAIADRYRCDLIGGDTTQGPLTLTLQVHGTLPQHQALTRDAARLGDSVFVTGTVGDGAAALTVLCDHSIILSQEQRQYLQDRFYQPEPQIETGKQLLPYARAAIDISDGLLADLQHIASASDVDISIDVDCIPASTACEQVFSSPDERLEKVLTGGDDYQLLFTVPENQLESVLSLIQRGVINATRIGHVVQKKQTQAQVYCQKNNQPFFLTGDKGYQHFAS